MRLLTILLIGGMAFSLFASVGASQETAKKDAAKGIEFFEKRIRPALAKYCYECHSAEAKRNRGGLALDNREAILEGGDTGPAVVPGDASKSLLMQAVTYEHKYVKMPPKEKLPDDVIADFRQWIAMGAPDPRGEKTVVAKKYGPAEDLWCLQAIRNPSLPAVKNAAWPRCGIDRFILARLEKAGLEPVKDADPLSLLRRVHFDLVGLPPSPHTVDAFLKNPSQENFVAIVDKLLASPQFGERWGRYWLDIARYADSNGKDRDVLFPHAWRYRNYVIDAFSADKPYNRFIMEQLAGDLLPAKDEKERDELTIATGFLAVGPKTFMQNGKRFQMELLDEQIDVTSRSILALTVSCARCHDHKFDPIPTADYYSMAGIFYSTKTLFGPTNRQKGNVNLQPLSSDAGVSAKERAKYEKNVTQVERKIRAFTNRLKKLRGEKDNPKQANLINTTRKRLKKAQNELKELKTSAPPPAQVAMAVKDDKKPVNLPIHIRGELNKTGEVVPRGFLSCVELEEEIKVAPDQSGRLQLAEWMTDPSNPLTARVMVNRIWHHLFGRGIVRTVDNFGSNGEKPSHPQLLDYLATKFMAEGWSVKRLIRAIVLSRTYQLASAYDEKNYEVDPDNALVWRHSMRRLDVEAIRDGILAASGKLDLERPEKSVVAQIGYGEVGRRIDTAPLEAEFNHRSAYLPILRTDLLEILKVFDFAEPSMVVGNRSITTVPAQALYLMNNPFVIDNAKELAGKLLRDGGMNDSDRIVLAHKLTLGRLPNQKEQQRASAFLKIMDQRLQEKYQDQAERRRMAWTSYCQALFASAEFRYLK